MFRINFFLSLALLLISITNPWAQNRFDENFSPLIFDASGQVVGMGGYYKIGEIDHWRIPVPPADNIVMEQMGTLVAPMYNTMSGGDSDEDSLFEAYMYIKDNVGGWTYTYRIYEDLGNFTFRQVFSGEPGMIPYAFGQLDGDGLPEVVGQFSFWVYVWESPAPGQYATNIAWQSPSISNVVGYTTVGDLDQDGHWEIIQSANSFGTGNQLVIFENTGNNQYTQIISQNIGPNNTGTKAIGDFDGDNLMEIALSDGGGGVYVFESTGNNAIQMTYHGNMGTWNAYACEYADDMDGNGKPEFICGGSDSNQGWVTQIYEAVADNDFAIRQEIIIYDNYFGQPGLAVGDFDADGVDEFAIQCESYLHIYKWNGLQYIEEGNVYENFGSILHGVASYDADNDGYSEVYWLGIGDGGYWTNNTIVLENEYQGPPPNITVNLIPDTLPIVIPAGGGSFDYTIQITNNETQTWNIDVRISAILPNGDEYIITQVDNVNIGTGATVIRQRTQAVPASAPAGDYTYQLLVGNLPEVIWGEDSFGFMKL
jgi:hypothetical protein